MTLNGSVICIEHVGGWSILMMWVILYTELTEVKGVIMERSWVAKCVIWHFLKKGLKMVNPKIFKVFIHAMIFTKFIEQIICKN